MQEDKLDAAFEVLGANTPRAPASLVERMVKTVNALERERARRAGTPEKAPEPRMARQNVREAAPKQIKR